jgi:hypothetical protein
MDLIERAELRTVRLPLYWSSVEASPPAFRRAGLGGLRPQRRACRPSWHPGPSVRLGHAAVALGPGAGRTGPHRRPAMGLGVLPASRCRPLRLQWKLLVGQPRAALPADPTLGDLERAEHRHLRARRSRAVCPAGPDLRPSPPRQRPQRRADPGRLLRSPPAGAAQRPLGRLSLAAVPGAAGEEVVRRRRAASLRRQGGGDARPDPKPAARDAASQRRPHADLRDRAGLGL